MGLQNQLYNVMQSKSKSPASKVKVMNRNGDMENLNLFDFMNLKGGSESSQKQTQGIISKIASDMHTINGDNRPNEDLPTVVVNEKDVRQSFNQKYEVWSKRTVESRLQEIIDMRNNKYIPRSTQKNSTFQSPKSTSRNTRNQSRLSNQTKSPIEDMQKLKSTEEKKYLHNCIGNQVRQPVSYFQKQNTVT